MKKYPGIDYSFRPATYWDSTDPLHAVLRNIKGQNRRQMVLDYAAQGRLEELDMRLLQEELDPAARDRLGSIHPSFLGGEYLPGYLPGEVEIARICLQSTTSDVISVRARPTAAGKIAYRVVDEYEADFVLPIPESRQPLTLAQLIRQLDQGDIAGEYLEGGLALGYNNMNAESGDYEALRHFTSVSSDIYDGLNDHYEAVFETWVRESSAEREEEE